MSKKWLNATFLSFTGFASRIRSRAAKVAKYENLWGFIRSDAHVVRAGIKLKGQPPLNNPRAFRHPDSRRNPAFFCTLNFRRRVLEYKKPQRLASLGLWRHHPESNWGIKVLQTSALPLGYGAIWSGKRGSNPPPLPWQGSALPNALFPHKLGASEWSRTTDTGIFSPLLYQLSYRGKLGDPKGARTPDLQRDRLTC